MCSPLRTGWQHTAPCSAASPGTGRRPPRDRLAHDDRLRRCVYRLDAKSSDTGLQKAVHLRDVQCRVVIGNGSHIFQTVGWAAASIESPSSMKNSALDEFAQAIRAGRLGFVPTVELGRNGGSCDSDFTATPNCGRSLKARTAAPAGAIPSRAVLAIAAAPRAPPHLRRLLRSIRAALHRHSYLVLLFRITRSCSISFWSTSVPTQTASTGESPPSSACGPEACASAARPQSGRKRGDPHVCERRQGRRRRLRAWSVSLESHWSRSSRWSSRSSRSTSGLPHTVGPSAIVACLAGQVFAGGKPKHSRAHPPLPTLHDHPAALRCGPIVTRCEHPVKEPSEGRREVGTSPAPAITWEHLML